MKVLLIHEHGRAHGAGAVVAMYRLHTALLKAGVESIIACRKVGLKSPDILELPRSDRLENLLGTLSWRIGLNDVHCVSSFKIKRFQPFLDADVVNIHGWHTNFFNYLALPGLAARKPLIGTMHDMWNITGHCAISLDCQRWKTGCGHCPYPEAFPPIGRDATALEWKLKSWTYRRSNMTFVAPSGWLLNLARQSMLKDHDLRQISNPVDHEVYQSLDKRDCRSKLGLPQDKHVILFVSVALESWAKGGDLLVAALDGLPASIKANSVLLLMGERGEEFAKACGIPAIAPGYVQEDQRKALMYSAADILIQPSRAENQSLVILEAMSCGTPVIAFDIGGNAEIVSAGPGGLVVEPENIAQLSQGITRLLEDRALRASLGKSARRSVIELYSLDVHCKKYIALYQEKIEQWRSTHSPRAANGKL